MGILYKLFHHKDIKRYDHIVSLGYNCEIAYQLFKHNHFLESNLLAWAYSPSLETTIRVLKNINVIGNAGFNNMPDGLMYECQTTKIRFHGKTDTRLLKDNPDLQKSDVEELTSRVNALKNKFTTVCAEESSKLFIVKAHGDEQNLAQNLVALYELLQGMNNGTFALLIVAEEKNIGKIEAPSDPNVFLRAVPFFAPDENVTGKHKNYKAWQRIFDEFEPRLRLKKTKKYKFEA